MWTKLPCWKLWNYTYLSNQAFFFSIWTKSHDKNLENEMSFWDKIKSTFHHFWALTEGNKIIFLEQCNEILKQPFRNASLNRRSQYTESTKSMQNTSERVYFIVKLLDVDLSGLQRGGWGEASPALFWKLKNSALILEDKALIVSIIALNLPFKM